MVKQLFLFFVLVTTLNEFVQDLLDGMRQPFKTSCDSQTLGLNLLVELNREGIMTQEKKTGERAPRGKPFVKGHEKMGGRKKGAPNQLTIDAILEAAALLRDKDEKAGYFSEIAVNHPRAYTKLLAMLLPKRAGPLPR